jgi:hypothetical protein
VDRHALGVEIGNLEGDQLAHAQAGGVGRRQQEPIAGVGAGGEESPDLLATEDIGEPLRWLGRRDAEVGGGKAERDVVEKPERVGRLGAGAPRALAYLKEMGDLAR